MEESHQQLQSLGRGILDAFKALAEKPWNANKNSQIPSKHRLSVEEERFTLWARSLGLNQTGHASLDYRVRDAPIIRASLADLLAELRDHMENFCSIILGHRLPLELDIEACRQSEAAPTDTTFSDDDTSVSSLSSAGSFQEAGFRLASVTARLDSLYKLATRIRSPRSRPQRPTKDLYKHVPETQRAQYIQNQQQIQVSLVAYVQQQQLREYVSEENLRELGFSQEQLLQEYAAPTHWLVRRMGIANARRKQQFVYWRKHTELLARDMTETPLPLLPKESTEAVAQPRAPKSVAGRPIPATSMATSVTKIDLGNLRPEDTKSTISSHSRVSTTVSPKGKELPWPPAPAHLTGSRYFNCPYCGILCPARYLSHDEWRKHQTHDLQPYVCTYEDCTDPNRLYSSPQEWLDHENQHRRVWHCHLHGEEFETQPDYMQHLHDKRLDHWPEDSLRDMVAAVVGASSKPHRDCPFCPTAFSDVVDMQRHVRYHLERISLYVLPDIAHKDGGEVESVQSSDSHQIVEVRGRQSSVTCDFTEEEEQSFLTILSSNFEDSQDTIQSEASIEGVRKFAANLALLPMPSALSDGESILTWRASIANFDTMSLEPAATAAHHTELSRNNEYTIGWMCALQTEYVAARAFLEKRHEPPEALSPYDNNDYTLGEIRGHRVVIAVLPDGEYGTSSTACVARDMLHSFPNIRFGLMVGIGGGAPTTKQDIRLGDVVVSSSQSGHGGLLQYDFGKKIQDHEFHQTGFLNQPPMILRTAVSVLQVQYEEKGHQLKESIQTVLEGNTRLRQRYAQPPLENDRLYDSQYTHLGNSQSDCAIICDSSKLIPRPLRGENEDNPAIHYGLIASGNRVIKDAMIRDKLAAERDILCFEMEAAGLMNSFPCLVIRGVCDYADSHNYKEWQGYAAMAAAAYAKDLLCQIAPRRVNAEQKACELLDDIQN